MIVLVTGTFEVMDRGRRTGRKEFLVSHGVDYDTGEQVVLPSEPPAALGGVFDDTLNEWVLLD